MNREIKFRAWHTKRRYWTALGMYHNSSGDIFGLSLIKDIVLMQYTGLKDKNGKEVYEGDIVTYGYDDGIAMAKIVFVSEEKEYSPWINGFQYDVFYTREYNSDNETGELKVIGNIYQNPELLPPREK